jgi:hypothetical protein
MRQMDIAGRDEWPLWRIAESGAAANGRGGGLANTGENSAKYTACQCISWLSFEWRCKTLKGLQVIRWKVEIQEWARRSIGL